VFLERTPLCQRFPLNTFEVCNRQFPAGYFHVWEWKRHYIYKNRKNFFYKILNINRSTGPTPLNSIRRRVFNIACWALSQSYWGAANAKIQSEKFSSDLSRKCYTLYSWNTQLIHSKQRRKKEWVNSNLETCLRYKVCIEALPLHLNTPGSHESRNRGNPNFLFQFLIFFCFIEKKSIPIAPVGYQMLKASWSIRALLAISHLISNARSWNDC